MIRYLFRSSVLLVVLAYLTGTATTQVICGEWSGEIGPETGGLAIIVAFNCDGPELTGSLDIPAQGVLGHELSNIVLGDSALAFRMPGVPGHPAYFGAIRDNRIEGVYTQGASELTFYLEPDETVDASNRPPRQRPQEPQQPHPYDAEDVTVETDDVRLTGTLTYPRGSEQPAPAVLLLSGSGMHDRDQHIAGHNWFHVLADHLTRAGIAVLRLDDRGVGGSTGNKNDATYEQLAWDAVSALHTLAEHPAVDSDRLGLIGHSQGASLALITEQLSDKVSFIVMLAGPATPGIEILEYQAGTLLPAQLQAIAPNPSNEVIQVEVSRQHTMLHQLQAAFLEDHTDEAQRLIRNRVEQQIEAGMTGPHQSSEAETEMLIQAQIEALMSEQFQSLLLFDPGPYLAELQVPLLAIYGSRDVQVDANANTAALERFLTESQRHISEIVTFDNLNHLLQPSDSGLPDEYPLIQTTINESVLALIADWINGEAIRETSSF